MKKSLFLTICFVLFSIPCVAAPAAVGFITGAHGLGDRSFNDMAYRGIQQAQKEYGFTLDALEPDDFEKMKDEDILGVIARSDIVVFLGAQHVQLAKDAAGANPGKKFVIIDIPADGFPNMSSAVFQQDEGAFLAGALAGAMTKTGVVGFVGGTAIPVVQEFERGYSQGVRHANPNATIMVEYAAPSGDLSGFSAPDKGYELAMAQYEHGADIIFAVAGSTGLGAIKAAQKAGRYVIGVDSNQDALAKGTVLTSMIKRLDLASYNELKAIFDGKFTPGVTRYGLKDGGVCLSEMEYTRERIAPGILKELDALKEKIINKEIIVKEASEPR